MAFSSAFWATRRSATDWPGERWEERDRDTWEVRTTSGTFPYYASSSAGWP